MSHSTIVWLVQLQHCNPYMFHDVMVRDLALKWAVGIVAGADDRCAGRTPLHCAAARAAPTLNLSGDARGEGAVNNRARFPPRPRERPPPRAEAILRRENFPKLISGFPEMNFTAFVIDVFVMDWFVINRDYFAMRVCDKY